MLLLKSLNLVDIGYIISTVLKHEIIVNPLNLFSKDGLIVCLMLSKSE